MEAVTQPVSKADIVFYFKVKSDEATNEKWWDRRMRDASRYGLIDCRASQGRGKVPPMFYPDRIAGWLIDQEHMDKHAAAEILRKHFPQCAEVAELLDPSEV